ncbi:MAG TPA: hypothetical protein GX717_01535 [Clostridiaceae bacterium]|nr:hypothetical protein [Clostridiaceae bacterium]
MLHTKWTNAYDVRALDVLAALNNGGYEAWFVGGCVRDALLDRPVHDYDVTTIAKPEEVIEVCGEHWHCIPTGIQHGTVTVVNSDLPIEVTTFRKDGTYSDGRRPDEVSFSNQLQTDLERRDFTINALVWRPEEGVKDLLGGRTDLARGIVRAVGDPRRRFTEDGLRILRGIRFSVELNFEIDTKTYEAMLDLAPLIHNVSTERVTEEFGRALLADVFLLPIGLPIWRQIFPDLLSSDNKHRDAYLVSLDWSDWQELPPDLTCRLATFLLVIQALGYPEAELDGWHPPTLKKTVAASFQMTDQLRLSRQQQRQLSGILSIFQKLPDEKVVSEDVQSRFWLRRQMADHGQESCIFVLSILRFIAKLTLPQSLSTFSPQYINLLYRRLSEVMITVLSDSSPRSLKHLAVDGEDLIAKGFTPGPVLGNILNALFEAVLAERVDNKYDALMAYIDQHRQELDHISNLIDFKR